MSVEIACLCEGDDDVEYPFEFIISSIVFSMFVLIVGEMSSFVWDINCVVDICALVDEARSVSEFILVLNIDVVEVLSSVAMDVVDRSFICSTEEIA